MRIALSTALILSLSACAGFYVPLIDGDYEQADLDACRVHAKTVNPITGAVAGAGVGAGVGLLLGGVAAAVFDVDVSEVARDSAILGGAGGGLQGLAGAMKRQTQIVDNCMRGRGYSVL